MKKIYVSGIFPRMYSAIKLFLDYPPKNYEYILSEDRIKTNMIRFSLNSGIIKFLYRKLIKKFFDTSKWYSKVCSTSVPQEAELVLSFHGNLELNSPWILIIVDHPISLTGYNYDHFIKNLKETEKKLLSPLCKKIIIFNEASMKEMQKYFSKEVLKKCNLVRAAVKKQDFKKDYDKKDILITFIGSTGNPDDFYIKGGLEAMESFKRISKEFQNAKMIIRCKVPEEVKIKYKDLKNMKILESPLSEEEWHDLLKKTDIVLQPGHIYPLMASLESLSFGIPIIMLDTWGVRDYLSNGKNAILIKPSKKIRGYKEKEYPLNVRNKEFIEDIKNLDESVITDLAESLRRLIKSAKLREKIGKNGKRTAETKFSIETRNKKLKKIYDEALMD